MLSNVLSFYHYSLRLKTQNYDFFVAIAIIENRLIIFCWEQVFSSDINQFLYHYSSYIRWTSATRRGLRIFRGETTLG